MKQLLFIAAIILLTTSAFAQNNTRYCDLSVCQAAFTTYVYYAKVNYSETPKKKYDAIRDNTGKKEKFSSVIGALNYMTKQGWSLVSAYYHDGKTHLFLKKGII